MTLAIAKRQKQTQALINKKQAELDKEAESFKPTIPTFRIPETSAETMVRPWDDDRIFYKLHEETAEQYVGRIVRAVQDRANAKGESYKIFQTFDEQLFYLPSVIIDQFGNDVTTFLFKYFVCLFSIEPLKAPHRWEVSPLPCDNLEHPLNAPRWSLPRLGLSFQLAKSFLFGRGEKRKPKDERPLSEQLAETPYVVGKKEDYGLSLDVGIIQLLKQVKKESGVTAGDLLSISVIDYAEGLY